MECVLRILALQRVGPTIHQTVWCIAIFVTLFSNVAYSVSDEECQHPNIFASAIAPTANQVGEFRITLAPPDYREPISVQQHLALSAVWGRLLRPALVTQTSGRCRAVVSRSLFPDIRVFLIDGNTVTVSEPSPCIHALQSMLRSFQPDRDEIDQALAIETRDRRRALSDPPGEAAETSNILTRALTQIYEADTVMHALASVKPELFESLNANAVLAWLQRQQASDTMDLRRLRLCDPQANRDGKELGSEGLPYSGIAPPGLLTLKIRSAGPTATGRLRHVVIVGEGPALAFSRSNPPAIEKYCNRERTVASIRDAVPDATKAIRIRCLRSVRFGAGWTVFYCDPADCASQYLAESAMAEIAADADVVALGRDMLAPKRDRGPYLVKVETEKELGQSEGGANGR